MSESKHTPGPWLPARLTTKTLNIVQVGHSFRCTVVGGAEGDAQIVATVHGSAERECEANARLVAAAPDLLEALRGLYEAEAPEGLSKTSDDIWERRAAASIAIAKAGR